MLVENFFDLLCMLGHERIEFFCRYQQLGSGIVWPGHRLDQTLALHMAHAGAQRFFGEMHAAKHIFECPLGHIFVVDRLLCQAVVQVPARQRLQQRMVFQLPLVQFRQADDQAPPIGWVLFDGFQWLSLFVCLFEMSIKIVKKNRYRYIINYIL